MARVRDLPQILPTDLTDSDLFYVVDTANPTNSGRRVTLGDLKTILADLQSSYNNSTDGTITTDTTRTAFKLREGTTVGGNLLELFDDTGVQVMSIDITGSITLSGTVDGRDISTDGSNVDLNSTHRVVVSGNPHAVTSAEVGLGNVTNDAQIPLTQKGAANGVAELDAGGLVPVAQLPGGSGVVSVNGDVGPVVVIDTDDVAEGALNLYVNTPPGQLGISANVDVDANSDHRLNLVNPHRQPIITTQGDRDISYSQVDTTGTLAQLTVIPWPGTNIVGIPTSITVDYTYRDNDVGFFCTLEIRDGITGLVVVNIALPQPPVASVFSIGFDLGALNLANVAATRSAFDVYGQRNQGGDVGRFSGFMINF